MKRHLSFVAALGICLFGLNAGADAQQIKAETGGIAIGGSVTGSTINIGIPPEQLAALVRQATDLSETQKKVIAKLESELDLNQRQIRAALGILGENDIRPERLAAKLVEIAERFKELQATASAQPGDDPKIAAQKIDARRAIDAGELAKADALLANVEAEQRLALDRLAANVAETSAQRGEIALTRLRYAEAAKHFGNAAAVFLPDSAQEDKRIGYFKREADALYKQGDEFGDNDALRSAIERRRALISLMPREHAPLAWAEAQNDLGLAFHTLGEREGGTEKLEQALVAFREALKERTNERTPLEWAMTQNNLGVTLTRLGERETGTAKLEEAVVAFQNAMKEITRDRAPLEWATIQSNTGGALALLAVREGGNTKKEEAIIAFREALKERTRERAPLDWAMTQINLANTLAALGELERAIEALREIPKEYTRERAPLYWAMIQQSVGMWLAVLGESETGTTKLEEAVMVLQEALKERTRERVPLDWAISVGTQGWALALIAQKRRDADMAESALGQINTAFETLRDGGNAQGAAAFEPALAEVRGIVTELRGNR
jgi:tetratricopeptide (TPR) repeat protein